MWGHAYYRAVLLLVVAGQCCARIENGMPLKYLRWIPKAVQAPAVPVLGAVEKVLTPAERYQKAIYFLSHGFDPEAVVELCSCDQKDFRVVFLLGLVYQYSSVDDCGRASIHLWCEAQQCFEKAFCILWCRILYHQSLNPKVRKIGRAVLSLWGFRIKLTGSMFYNALCAKPCLSAAWKEVLRDLQSEDPVLHFDICLYTHYMNDASIKRIVQEILRIERAREAEFID